MPLFFALLLSLALHITLFAAPSWFEPSTARPPVPESLDVTLLPPPDVAMAESISTQIDSTTPTSPDPAPLPTPQKPNRATLRKAQHALARHLFYPPQAVELGLEGEVTLLLILDASGRIVTVDVARSSGHALLDRAALAAAQSIGRLPGSPRQTLLPVSFNLQ